MTPVLDFKIGNATSKDLLRHLLLCDESYLPKLSQRVELPSYASKIQRHATTFEAWSGFELVGLVAAYLDKLECGYVTNVSVCSAHMGKGVARCLMGMCIAHALERGIEELDLEVFSGNKSAINLYQTLGFKTDKKVADSIFMKLKLTN